MKKKAHECDVGAAWLLQQKYGLYAENRPEIAIDPAQVPDELKPLIPTAERWAIGCDITRLDYIHKQPPADVRHFHEFVRPFRRAIDAWLDALPDDFAEWPDAAGSFMYLAKAHDEAYEPTPEEIRLRDERWERETRPKRMEQASLSAADAFREGNYVDVVEWLQPFEAYLGRSDHGKLVYARKRLAKPWEGAA